MSISGNPACSAIRAVMASWTHGTTTNPGSAMIWRSSAAGLITARLAERRLLAITTQVRVFDVYPSRFSRLSFAWYSRIAPPILGYS